MSGNAMFLADLVPGGDFGADCSDFSEAEVGSFLDDDAEQFSTATINSDKDESHSNHSGSQPMHDGPSVPPPATCTPYAFPIPTEISTKHSIEFPITPTTTNTADDDTSTT